MRIGSVQGAALQRCGVPQRLIQSPEGVSQVVSLSRNSVRLLVLGCWTRSPAAVGGVGGWLWFVVSIVGEGELVFGVWKFRS